VACKSNTDPLGKRQGRYLNSLCAPVAQLDRVLDYESRGRAFESLRVHHFTFHNYIFYWQVAAHQHNLRVLVRGFSSHLHHFFLFILLKFKNMAFAIGKAF
jgi:hypothetical protein